MFEVVLLSEVSQFYGINPECIFSSIMSKNFISCQQLLISCQSLPSKPPKQDSLPRLISTKTKVRINLASELSPLNNFQNLNLNFFVSAEIWYAF